jgi:superfamily I DNA/RNA helicase
LAAARAPGGVVQVIAPAGSGKTTALIERVRELRERLSLAGVQGAAARTFHSVGYQIIRKRGLIDGRTLHAEGWTVAQWARFAPGGG